jgi:hypothetical protein
MKKPEAQNEIVIYRAKDGRPELEISIRGETLWLNLQQIADLFDRDKSVVSRHIRNIYATGELVSESTVAKNATVQKEGGRQVEREIEYYSLDVILSVGYRVNSNRGVYVPMVHGSQRHFIWGRRPQAAGGQCVGGVDTVNCGEQGLGQRYYRQSDCELDQ